MNSKIVHILIANGVEEMEAIAPVDLLRRADVTVKILSLHEHLMVEGRNGIEIGADALFEDHLQDQPDMIIIPGGPSHTKMLADPRVIDWIKDQHQRGGWIASICAGPLVLDRAGVLQGKKFTAHFTTATDLQQRNPTERVVSDDKLITSQGAGTSIDFALCLVAKLCGTEKMETIKASIAG